MVFYEGLFGILYKRYMVIYLSIIGIQCKHDIVLIIRTLLRSKMQTAKENVQWLYCSIWYVMLNKTHKNH